MNKPGEPFSNYGRPSEHESDVIRWITNNADAEGGAGGSGDRLAHAETGLTDEYPQKTIGNFWPHATTLLDFIRRSMPMHNPGSLSDDETCSLTAYLLSLDNVLPEDAVMNRDTLPKVTMPNHDGFIDVWQDDPLNTAN